MIKQFFALMATAWSLMALVAFAQQHDTISLAGTWRFAADEDQDGVRARWYAGTLPDTIRLPGSAEEQHKVPPITATRGGTGYEGQSGSTLVWFQKDVSIPETWRGKRITLLLERTKYTSLWVDGKSLGDLDSLTVAHVYDLTAALPPGKHRLTILVDPVRKLPVSGFHLRPWSGIVGRIELNATDLVWFDDVQIYPDVPSRQARVRFTIGNLTPGFSEGTIICFANSWNNNKADSVEPVTIRFSRIRNGNIVEGTLKFGPGLQTWDEFSPTLYKLTATLKAQSGHQVFADQTTRNFGMREFTTKGTQFQVNGKTIFLRGKHDSDVFPLSSYAPMTVDSWLHIFRIARSYGINLYRFHTWTPSEAAFEAADIIGMYLQPELINYAGDFSLDLPRRQYSLAEFSRIVHDYGDHPSFAMLSMGNENFGGRWMRTEMIKDFRSQDPRRLYAQASNYEFDSPPSFANGDDYWTTMRVQMSRDGSTRGSYSPVDLPLGHIQTDLPSTSYNYEKAVAAVPVPLIGHEFGQWDMVPDLKNISRFSGVTSGKGLEVYRDRLQAAGMLDQAEDFFKASGALMVSCYREDLEAALRTKGYGGVEILDIMDDGYRITVGILDAFMESKGLIKPEEWRQFLSPTVLLAVIDKYEWTGNENFQAKIRVANYGPESIAGASIDWTLKQSSGKLVGSGTVPAQTFSQGELTENAGRIQARLDRAETPSKLTLSLAIRGTGIENSYDVWVYPAKVRIDTPLNVTVSRRLDENTKAALAAGRRVLLLPEPAKLTNGVQGWYASDFWNWTDFNQGAIRKGVTPAAGTEGLLINAHHPALSLFPSEAYSTWQWFPIVMNSKAVVLDDMPQSYRPIVQDIDNYDRMHKLGVIFEAKVGTGRLLVCTSDLLTLEKTDPAARQLLASLMTYVGSPRFVPTAELTLDSLLRALTEER